MHTHLNFAFKQAVHFSKLAIKLFNSSIRLFQAIKRLLLPYKQKYSLTLVFLAVTRNAFDY